MECKAVIKSVFRDFRTGRFILTLGLEGVTQAQLEDLDDKEFRLKLTKWRQKRSLDANAYMWVLLSKMALKLNVPKEELYEQAIMDYSFPAEDENGPIVMTIKSEVEMDKVPGYWKLVARSPDLKWKSMVLLLSSSEFDTKQMSFFLDRIIEEAQELGIDTETPDEIERMKQTWGVNTGASSQGI